jgi:hypothetical protein
MKMEGINRGIVTIGEQEALAYFKALSWLSQEETEDSHKKESQLAYLVTQPRFKLNTSK